MFQITLSIMPVFLLLMLGFTLRKSGFVPEEIWTGIDKLVYWFFFPALLFTKTAIAPIGGDILLPYLTSLQGAVLASAIFIWLCIPFIKTKMSNPSISSVFQGAIRYNTYIGFAVIVALEGQETQFYGALATAVMVPFVNILCVTTLASLHGPNDTHIAKRIPKELIKNPLLMSIFAGIIWNLTGFGQIPVITPTLESLSSATLAIGVLSVGAGLKIKALKTAFLPILLSSIGKFIILPTTAWFILGLWDLQGLPAFTLFLFSALPTAASGYALARQMGGDVSLIAGLITIQTLLSMILLPFVIQLGTYLYL